MKAEILKIAGVKNEKEFYKKFPTKEAFMKVYSKEFKKAKLGKAMPINKIDDRRNQLHQLTSFEGDVDGMIPKAQDGDDIGGFLKRVGNRNCRGKSWCGTSGGDNAGGGSGGGYDAFADNTPVTSKELMASGYDVYDKKTIKKMAKDLEADFPGVTPDILAMAIGEQARLRAYSHRHADILKAAAEADKLRKTDVNAANALFPFSDRFYGFYGPQMEMDEQGKVKIPDPRGILSMYSSPKEFETFINRNYQQMHGGTTHRKAQGGLTMPQPTNIMTNVNPFWAQSQFGAPDPQGGMLNPTPPPTALTGPLPGYISNPGALVGGVQQSLRNLPLPGATSVTKAAGKTDFLGKMGGPAGLANLATDVISGVRMIQEEKEEDKRWQQANRVSDVQMLASQVRPEPINRKYTRPEDVVIQPEQLFPTYGTGYNAAFAARNGSVVKAEDGMQIGGNLTEIQNMYNPGDLYSDLGFEPLNDSDKVKQYYGGGYIPQAQMGQSILQNVGGFAKQMGKQYGTNSFKTFLGSPAGANIATQLGSYLGNPITRMQSAGSKIGGGIGKGLGTAIGGPIGGFVGNLAGNIIGGALDKSQERIAGNQERVRKNINIMTGQDFARGMQGQFGSYMEHGGWVSHDWQPQVITHFGEHSMKSLLKPDPTMDTLRSGGHIRQNNMSPMDQYGFGGELQTTWGGYAEPISQNPYLPGTGETVMFRGKSHDERDGKGRTGIGVKYGNDGEYSPYMEYGKDGIEDVTDVEVERGEPAQEMVDPKTGEKNMVVFGNLKIPNKFLGEIGDPKAKGKKFKHYVAGLSKEETKHNKLIDKSVEKLIDLDLTTSFDKLKWAALQANIMGANMKLKDIAEKKTNAASVQNAINETSEEMGLDADALAKGKVKIDKEAMNQTAKWGKAIKKAQTGTYYSAQPGFVGPQPPIEDLEALYQQADQATGKRKKELTTKFQREFHRYFPSIAKNIILSDKEVTGKGKKMGYNTIDQLKNASDEDILETNVDGQFERRTRQYHSLLSKLAPTPPPAIQKQPLPVEKPKEKAKPQIAPVAPLKRNPWIDAANTLLPYLRPTDQMPLDPAQLYGEMYALSSNQLEPVRAQGYRPQLLTPYDISLQDQLNEVTAQTRAAERMAGNNPAAMAAISAQANRAKSQILGEQMRQNQAQRMGVYNQNINTLNQAQLQNLGIYDQQYVRQEQAKSNTKAVAQAALNSIGDKIAKNKLENRTLGIMENMYDYRFDRRGRAINMNPLAQFDVTAGGSSGRTTGGINPDYEFTYDASGQIIGTRKKSKDDIGRNGRIVKAIKNL